MKDNQAGRRYWAMMLKRMGFALAFAFALGLLFDWYFNEDPERVPLWAGMWGIAIYLAASAIFGLFNIVSGLLYLGLAGRSELVEAALADLRNSRLPAPTDIHFKRFDYLVAIADDREADPDIRVRAGALHASYQVAIQRAGLFGGLALSKALDDAALRYAQEAPRG